MTVPYNRPSYTDLQSRIAADLAAVPAALSGPISVAWAKSCHGEHGHLAWIDAQCSPLTCELERLYDWAALYGVDRLTATGATGVALATGTVGTPLLAGTLLRGQNGMDYTVSAAVTLGDTATPVAVRCTSTGAATNLLAGQTLTLVDPVPGCSGTLVVDAPGLTGGADDELVDDWRVRVADEWRTVVTWGARSGRPEDYRFWARSAHPSVTTALVQKHTLGLGTVVVRPICNGLPDRLPTQGVLDAVAAYLTDHAPATADWRLALPIVRAVPLSIHLLPGFDTTANRAAIEAAVIATVLAEASEEPLLAVAEVDAAIATVTSQYTRIQPTTDMAVLPGEVLVPTPIVWVP